MTQRLEVGKGVEGMDNGRLRIGLDLDDTITAAPELFRALSAALVASGHEVHIVTYRPDSTEECIAEDLRSFGIAWTAIHHPRTFLASAGKWKRSIALTLALDMLIDDDADVAAAVADVTVALHVSARSRS